MGSKSFPFGRCDQEIMSKFKKISKMKVLKNGCNLNGRKGLVSVILTPRTVRKIEVTYRSYEGLKSPVNSKNELIKFDFFIWEKIY